MAQTELPHDGIIKRKPDGQKETTSDLSRVLDPEGVGVGVGVGVVYMQQLNYFQHLLRTKG